MKQNILNTSGSNPNYLNTSTTSREISFNEITPIEGSLSESLKDFKVVFENDFYFCDNISIYNELLVTSEEN